jgi:hypothetical protein
VLNFDFSLNNYPNYLVGIERMTIFVSQSETKSINLKKIKNMKKFFSANDALVELLNEQIEMTCNADMEIIVSDEDAERIAEIVATLAPAAINDYTIEDVE